MTSHQSTSRHVTAQHIASHHITLHDEPHISHHITSHHITPHHATWHHITWHDPAWHHNTQHDTWHDMTWHNMTWPDLTWHDMTSRNQPQRLTLPHLTTNHVTSCHLSASHMTSQQITSPPPTHHKRQPDHQSTTSWNGWRRENLVGHHTCWWFLKHPPGLYIAPIHPFFLPLPSVSCSLCPSLPPLEANRFLRFVFPSRYKTLKRFWNLCHIVFKICHSLRTYYCSARCVRFVFCLSCFL